MSFPDIDIITLKSLPYEKLVQNLILSLRQCIDWIRTIDISTYKQPVLTQFVHDNRKKVGELIAIIDMHTVGCAGDTDLHIEEIDTVLDRLLFEFDEACNDLLQRLDPKTSPNTIKTDRLKRLMTLAFYCLSSFVISSSTTFSVKKMQQSQGDHKLPWFVAMMQGFAVFLNFCIWAVTRHYKQDKMEKDGQQEFWLRLRAYLALGIVDAGHIMLQSYSLVNLPGSIYTVLKGSGIIFSVVLSKLVVKKVFLLEHWLAVVFMCISTIGCALFQSSESSGSEFSDFIFGFSCTLASCFLVALLGVLQQKLMCNFKHSDQTVLIMAETNFFQSLVVFPIVLIAALCSPESRQWRPLFANIAANGDHLFFCLAGLLVLVRSLSVFSAMGVTTYSSAMFSRSYGAIRHSLQVIVLSLLLDEKFQNSKKFALIVSSVSFSIYIYAGYLLQQLKMGKNVTGLRGILYRK